MTEPEDWFMYVEGHLYGANPPVGVYPMETMIDDDITTLGAKHGPYRWVVKWGCVDFDEGEEESWVHASNVSSVLAQFGIKGWVERSRSKGYHVWVFLADWMDAGSVRDALLGACQIVGAPTKEINPKQASLQEGQLGNYVRLPYPGGLGNDAIVAQIPRRVMVSKDGQAIGPESFIEQAHGQLASLAAIDTVAGFYVAPAVVAPRNWESTLEGDAIDRLAGKARIIFDQGPLWNDVKNKYDRSDALWKLACYLHEDGRHTVEEALDLLRDADMRWGKFSERPDGEQHLAGMIQKAFAGIR